ncbi:hypothetical protein CHUAL_008568 [Chamberlinius hualienensis]
MRFLGQTMTTLLFLAAVTTAVNAMAIEAPEQNVGLLPSIDAAIYSFSNATTYRTCGDKVVDLCNDCVVRYDDIDFGNQTVTEVTLKYSNYAKGAFFAVQVYVDGDLETSVLIKTPRTTDWCTFFFAKGAINIGPGLHSIYIVGRMDVNDPYSNGIDMDTILFQ